MSITRVNLETKSIETKFYDMDPACEVRWPAFKLIDNTTVAVFVSKIIYFIST